MSEVNIDASALRDAVALGQKLGTPQIGEAIHFALVPNGTDIKSLAQFQFPNGIRPERIIGTVQLRDAASFTKYYQLFADDRSRIFAEPSSRTFLGVLDYHGIGDERKVEFLSHRAQYQMQFDERWNIWTDKNEHVFTQVEFAEYVEDNIADISDPSGAAMLEVARDLKASSSANFESKVTPKNGQVQMRYAENIDGKVGTGDLEVPEFFKLSIPVFYGEQPIQIQCRLRWRIQGGTLKFWFKLYRKSEILNDAFNKAAASIAESIKGDVLLGSPA